MEKNYHISIIILVFSLFATCCGRVGYGNIESRTCHDSLDLGFRYIIDTITIKDPLLAIYDDELYVMAGRYADDFVKSPHLKDGIHMFHILPRNIREDVMDLFYPYNRTDFTERAMSQLDMAGRGHLHRPWTSRLIFETKMGQVEFYRFMYRPARFLLELVWVDPDRYKGNPYGPDRLFIVDDQSSDSLYQNLSKLDSLECFPRIPRDNEKAHYEITVEPLYSLSTVNQSIIDCEKTESNEKPVLFPKWVAKKYCFPDL